jgi:DNA-binding NarL/FixJ family response regulator
MRKTINIIWIDDKMKRKGFSDLTEKNVRSALDAKGYKAFIVKHDDPDEALKYLNLHKETRWDFVLADLNLRDEEKSGIYLLTSLRSSGNQTPFFILYSNEEPEKVKKEISEAVKDPDSNLSSAHTKRKCIYSFISVVKFYVFRLF